MIPDFCPAGSRGLLGNFGELFKINKIIFRLKTEIFTNSTEIMDQRNPKRVLLLSPDVYRSCLSLRGNDLLSGLTDIRMWRRGNVQGWGFNSLHNSRSNVQHLDFTKENKAKENSKDEMSLWNRRVRRRRSTITKSIPRAFSSVKKAPRHKTTGTQTPIK